MKKTKILSVLTICMLVMGVFCSCKKSKTTPVPPTPLPPANLLAYWPLDNNALDKSRYGNNGTAHDVTSTVDRYNKANSAFHFDGVSSYISVPDSVRLRLANTDFTLNAWIKLDRYDYYFLSTIISKRLNGNNNGWLWGINGAANSPLGATYYGPGGGNTNAIGSTVLSVNQWYMITCVYTLSDASMRIYVNGILDQKVDGILPANGAVAATLNIGKDTANGDAYLFNGSLDEIKIYNTALDLPAIQSLYTATN